MHFTTLALMFIGGYAWCKAWIGIKEYFKMPYRWACPECQMFATSANQKEAMESAKELHQAHCTKGAQL